MKDIFTLSDNHTYDLGRILWCLFSICFMVLAIIHVLKNGDIDLLAFGGGSGAILGSGAAGIRFKEPAESTGKQQKNS